MRPRTRERGYTIVELMMAIAVFAIGVTGIAAMQKLTLASNLHAKRLAIATHIAQSWQERLEADSSLWPTTAQTKGGTQWLGNADTGWVRAPENDAGTFGATFGPLGDYTKVLSEAYFCVDIRLTSLNPTGSALQGNGLIRTEVRVFWPRDGREPSTDTPYCASSGGVVIDGNSDEEFHFVHKVAAVRQTP